jgi:hypothetical protein
MPVHTLSLMPGSAWFRVAARKLFARGDERLLIRFAHPGLYSTTRNTRRVLGTSTLTHHAQPRRVLGTPTLPHHAQPRRVLGTPTEVLGCDPRFA